MRIIAMWRQWLPPRSEFVEDDVEDGLDALYTVPLGFVSN